MQGWKKTLAALCLTLCMASGAAAQQTVFSGNLSSSGSDTMANLMGLWRDAFAERYPNVNVQIQAVGSSSAPTSLAVGTAQLGPMSRPMKAAEIAAFEQRYGYPPLAIPVALDALVILVHQDNPLQSISFRQLDAVFSRTLRCGAERPVSRWRDLGLKGSDWQNRTLVRYGRNSASGTYGFFKQQALCNGDFINNVNELPGSSSVVQAVAGSLNAIGYASVGFRASGVHALAVRRADEDAVMPTRENVMRGDYPLTRSLYIYVNKPPGQALSPSVAAFIDVVLSPEGQELVMRDGYLPLAPTTVSKVRAMLALDDGKGARPSH